KNPAELNFQVLLFETGDIEFRWGEMNSTNPADAEGGSAIIGLHNRAGTKARLVSNKTRVPGGLKGRSYYFFPDPTPLQGSRTLYPESSMTYTLRAWNGHSEHVESIEVRVHPPGHLDIWTVPEDPLPGDHVTLHWEGKRLTQLTIRDEAGNLVLEASGSQLEAGSLDLGVLPQGIYRYDFDAVGQAPIDRIQRRYSVSVNGPYGLVDFSASATRIKKGESVTLSWETFNATSLKIIELPGGNEIVIPPQEFDGGSRTVTPQVTTTYVLELESHERHRRAEQIVQVRTVWIDEFYLSKDKVVAGGNLDVFWETTEQGELTLDPPPGMIEVFDSPYEDISSAGPSRFTPNTHAAAPTVNFPVGFTFPYFGQTFWAVRVTSKGFISFDLNANSVLANYPLPNATYPYVHLSPFWDDLCSQANGKAVTEFRPNPDRFII